MRAVLVTPEAPGRLALGEIEAPTPQRNEALIKVAAVSLNRGEIRGSAAAPAGQTIGWDLSGTVEQQAEDGSVPKSGTRVVGAVATAACAEYVAVPTIALAELPSGVSFAQAATLPVAGLTALRGLEKGGLLLERKVLITGASGGVGQFACQIARLSGAYVVAAVRQDRSEAPAREAGAHDVVVGDDLSAAAQYGPFDLILESVGGQTLATAMTLLAPEGTCVAIGVSGGNQATFDIGSFYHTGGTTLYGFIVFYEARRKPVAGDLARLVRLVADGRLKTRIEFEAPWTQVGEAAQKLTERSYVGKGVLHVTPD
jgi:NADPH:quinone reductase-like Zn-dependent oxidoreductase